MIRKAEKFDQSDRATAALEAKSQAEPWTEEGKKKVGLDKAGMEVQVWSLPR